MNRKSIHLIVLASLLAAGCGLASETHFDKTGKTSAASSHQDPVAPLALPDFTSLVAKYGSAVVNISVTNNVKVPEDPWPFNGIRPDNPLWPFPRGFQWPSPPSSVTTQSVGSGFIVSSDGYILTNAHVIDDAKAVTVKLVDRRELTATVVGKDNASDVAVLKIDAHFLPVAKLGDSSHVQVGQWVMAIGSPFGFENSVTAGIISAKARSLPNGGYVPYLQTDAAVNPGNSGGPLFNLSGEVIGINAQIYSGTGGFQGISFAIPINIAEQVEGQIIRTGHVTHGRIGVMIQDVDQSLAQSFGLPKPSGALVSSVTPGSAAAKAGIHSGDIILNLNGQDITQSGDLAAQVAQIKPGTDATLRIWRKGSTIEVALTVGDADAASSAWTTTGNDAQTEKLGLTVRPLTPNERRVIGTGVADGGGLSVTQARGAAAQAGIEDGDVILSVNGTPVSTVEQLRTLVTKAKHHVALLVLRGDSRIFIPITIG
jgi:serine protease Do